MCDFGLSRVDPQVVPERDTPGTKTDKERVAKHLIATKHEESKKTRCLSRHVVTRVYRPPEVILTERRYSTKIDVWSLGCCLAELIWCANMDKKLFNNDNQERILFKGTSSYPLSPAYAENEEGLHSNI